MQFGIYHTNIVNPEFSFVEITPIASPFADQKLHEAYTNKKDS
mgnify:CR=1 FL=1